MTIESWLPAFLGYMMPLGLFLLAWGGMAPDRARRSATVGALVLALGAVGYFTVGFAFHLGGAGLMTNEPGLSGLTRLFAGEGELEWGLLGLSGFFLGGDAATPEVFGLFFAYLPAVVSAALLAALSVAGRRQGWRVTTVGLMTSTIFLPPVACWAWGGGWLAKIGSTLERGHGFVDYGGSGVVFLLGGSVALGVLLGMGDRLPKHDSREPQAMPPSHFPLLANLGALLFGLGWIGWSLSKPFHVGGAEVMLGRTVVNGLLAAAGAILASQLYCWFATGESDALMSARGATAGFVAIGASAPFVPPWAAFLTGVVAGFLLPLGVFVVESVLRLPDETATAALGFTAGAWGLLAVALFADGRAGQGWNGIGLVEYRTVLGQGVTGFLPVDGFIGDGQGQLVAQLAGLGAIAVPATLVSALLFYGLALASMERDDRRAWPLGRGWLGTLRNRMNPRRQTDAEVEEP